jgi:putative ABC transport system permease protein
MISEENLMYALRNLRSKKGRSILTIISIFIGITTIFIFISFGLGLFSYVNDLTTGSAADKIIVQSKGVGAPGLDDTFKLRDSDLSVIEKVSGVIEVTGSSWGVAEIQKKKQKKFNFIASYDPKKPIIFDISGVNILEGRHLSPRETKKVILGYNYKIEDKIFMEPLEIGDSILLQGEKVDIVGFVEEIGNPTDDATIYVTKEYMIELFPKTDGTHSWIVAQVDVKNIEKIVEDIEKAVRKNKGQEKGKEDFYVQSFEELVASFSGAINLIIGFVILIALISVLVSAVNTANTMITSVIERTREIGVIKSVGAENSEILKIFLLESSILGVVSGILGVFVGWIVTFIAAVVLDNLGWGFLSPQYSFWLFIGLIIFAGLTGAISGITPAWRASKISAVDALRYEQLI